mgnify:FL=1
MDKTTLIGCWGALATVSGKISEWVGITAGLFTITYLTIKIVEALKKK